MKARVLVSLSFLLLAALALLAAGCGERAPDRPDSVLLVTLDTLRADYVSAYNPESPVKTERFDALAAEGALMTRAWSTVPLTTPAHCSIMSGLYPPGHGVRNNARFRLPEDVPTLAEVLRDRGRETAAFTAAFTTSSLFGLAQGFDLYDDDLGHSETGSPRSSRPGDEVLLSVLRWFEERDNSRPFFLWVHLFDPHTPYNAPIEFSNQYPRDAYAGEVAFTDFILGRVLDELDNRGLSERTIVAVMADHGEGLGTHGEPEHGLLLYEEVLHIPFALKAPGLVDPGRRVEQTASVVDVMPTLLSLLEIELPGPVDGRDLFGDEPPTPPYAETLYPHEEFGWSALYARREGDQKLIVSSENELYDLAEDPREGQDLSADRPERVQEMRRALEGQVADLIDEARLAAAAGFGGAEDPETIARLESLGYVAGGGGAGGEAAEEGESSALGATTGRNPRHAMGDYELFKKAQEFQSKGQLDTARGFFERLVKNDPDNPQFGLKLAGVLDQLEDVEAAEAAYRDLVARHPTFYLATQSFSSFLERQGRPLESRQLWMRLASEVPGYVGVETRIARAEIAAELYDAAEQRLERFLADRPDSSRGWALLGQALEGQGREDEALEAFLRSLDLRPTETRALDGMVRVLRERGDAARARELLRALLERAPRDPMIGRLLQELNAGE